MPEDDVTPDSQGQQSNEPPPKPHPSSVRYEYRNGEDESRKRSPVIMDCNIPGMSHQDRRKRDIIFWIIIFLISLIIIWAIRS